eukprot:1183129-Prorocentrum_minimum.AAC.2
MHPRARRRCATARGQNRMYIRIILLGLMAAAVCDYDSSFVPFQSTAALGRPTSPRGRPQIVSCDSRQPCAMVGDALHTEWKSTRRLRTVTILNDTYSSMLNMCEQHRGTFCGL